MTINLTTASSSGKPRLSYDLIKRLARTFERGGTARLKSEQIVKAKYK